MRKERRKESGGDRKREREREKEKNIKAMGRGYIIPALGPSAFAFENKMRKHGPSLLDPSSTRSVDKDGDEGDTQERKRKRGGEAGGILRGILRKGAEEF